MVLACYLDFCAGCESGTLGAGTGGEEAGLLSSILKEVEGYKTGAGREEDEAAVGSV